MQSECMHFWFVATADDYLANEYVEAWRCSCATQDLLDSSTDVQYAPHIVGRSASMSAEATLGWLRDGVWAFQSTFVLCCARKTIAEESNACSIDLSDRFRQSTTLRARAIACCLISNRLSSCRQYGFAYQLALHRNAHTLLRYNRNVRGGRWCLFDADVKSVRGADCNCMWQL